MIRRSLCLLFLFFSAQVRAVEPVFPHDIAVTPHPLATEAAIEIYERGGNAVDAAVAAAFALGVVEPQNSGLGGGGFMLAFTARDEGLHALDYREEAASRSAEHVYQEGDSREGWKSAAVPGFLAGMALAVSKYGNLSIARIVEPSLRLAEDGFAATPLLAEAIAERADCLARHPATRKIYFPSGEPLRARETLVQKDLAATLRGIMQDGPQTFYKGALAERIDRASRDEGGFLRKEDLRRYRAKERTPFSVSYRGYEIRTMPLPSSGGVLMKTMFASVEDKAKTPQEPAALAAAMKKAFAERASLGDPDFSRNRQTTHAVFADRLGNVVSMTNSLNLPFGSCVTVPGTGILLNDHMDDFTTRPNRPNAFGLMQGEANRIEPGKRPLSSMSPTIVLKDGRPVYALGTPGGPTIITNVFQTIVNLIDRGLSLQAAIDAPKMHHQFSPDIVRVHKGYPASDTARLRRAGFSVQRNQDWGNLQAVELDGAEKRLRGASDRRGEGEVGYARGYSTVQSMEKR